jgi:hypothetical protein
MTTTLVQRLKNKTITPDTLADKTAADPTILPDILAGLHDKTAAIRYGSSKTLIILSQTDPQLLYPHFDDFVHLLDSPHRILTWNALTILANLTTVDTQKKFDNILKNYYSHLTDGYLVTVNTIIQATPTIITAKPYLTDTILTYLLSTETLPTNPHLTTECKRIVASKLIPILDTLYPQFHNHKAIHEYISRNLNSTRPATRTAAQTFLKHHGDHP